MTTAELTALLEGLIPVVQLQMQRGFEVERTSVRTALDIELGDLKKRNTQLEMRILELETRPAVVGPQGPQGERGEVGPAGKDAPPWDIQWLTASVLEALPKPEKGELGDTGPAGKDAPPVDVDGLVTRVAALVPAGKDGVAGKDGIGLTSGLIDRSGHLILMLSDGSPKDLGPVVGRDGQDGKDGTAGKDGEIGRDGKDVDMTQVNALITRELATWPRPKDGKDGLDGLGFDDYNLVLDPMKGWILRLQQGDRIKDFDIPMPFFAGNWQAGSSYPKAAGVRWEGHYWWALKETSQQPGEGSSDWQLVVSRGKEGREGKRGKDGTPGRDLTQMGLDGKKW